MRWMFTRLCLLAVGVVVLVTGVLAAAAAQASAAAPQQLRVLVVKATWGPQPYSDVEIDAVMRGVERFYATSSFGQVSMSYMQTPWLDVMSGPLSCDDAEQRLPALAEGAGWNSTDYDRVIFLVVSDQDGCDHPFDDPTGDYLPVLSPPEAFPVGATIHELGHSFGMEHAGILTCWYQQKKRLCSGDPSGYGDVSDVMGDSGGGFILAYVGDFGALQKARAGWLTPTYVTKPGSYRLAPLEVASMLPQALVIRGSAYEYWIDERAPLGNDAHIGGPEMTGFAVHRVSGDPLARGATRVPDYLLPNAHSSSYYTPHGKTFTLPGLFTLTALSRTHGVITIRYRALRSRR